MELELEGDTEFYAEHPEGNAEGTGSARVGWQVKAANEIAGYVYADAELDNSDTTDTVTLAGSVALFDEQRASGRVPAKQQTRKGRYW